MMPCVDSVSPLKKARGLEHHESKTSGFQTTMLCNLVENRGVVHKFKIPRYLLVFTKYHGVL